MRSAPIYTQTALDEIALLKEVRLVAARNPDHPGRDHLVTFIDSFEQPSRYTTMLPHVHYSRVNLPPLTHVCMTFEPLGENVLSLLRRPEYDKRGLPLLIVKQVAKQILQGLDFLHTECGLIHTDLKPENVLIAIEDVETIVKEVMEKESVSQSVPMGIPSGPGRSSHRSSRQSKQVLVFGSQPLPSPTHTIPTTMSQLSNSTNASAPVLPSVSQSTSSSMGAAESPFTLSTAPTSLGVSILAVNLPPPSDTELVERIDVIGGKVPLGMLLTQAPSLLSQTSTALLPLEPMPRSRLSTSTERGDDADTHSPLTDIRQDSVTPVLSILAPSPEPEVAPTVVPPSPQSTSHVPVPTYPQIRVKIADLGNATPVHHHYTNNIQTRHYRCPEVILGHDDWDTGVDVWSAACLVRNLLILSVLHQQGFSLVL
jgi:serine/threonine-protein kinase SRPK3